MNFLRLALALALSVLPRLPLRAAPAPAPLWVAGYYPGWQQEKMPPSAIDFGAVTHLIHFSVLPRADGTLDAEQNGLSLAHSRAAIAAAHRAGRQVLVCVGGADSGVGFHSALQQPRRARLVAALVQFARERGYDGLDLDMEPIEDADAAGYEALVRELRVAMRRANPKWLLTAATASQPAMFARLSASFDQINLMTYDLSGPWEGWVTWHNSALSSGAARFPAPNSQRSLPSVQSMVQDFLRAGIEPRKLGLGLAFYGVAFYGVAWHGASLPQQPVEGLTTTTLDYAELMRSRFSPARRRWDAQAQVPYLSIGSSTGADSLFISYDDEQSLRLKVRWARARGLGGAIIWELAGGYRAELPANARDTLLKAVGGAARER